MQEQEKYFPKVSIKKDGTDLCISTKLRKKIDGEWYDLNPKRSTPSFSISGLDKDNTMLEGFISDFLRDVYTLVLSESKNLNFDGSKHKKSDIQIEELKRLAREI